VCRCCAYPSAGNAFTYQITLASTDLLLHSSFDPKGKVSPIDLFQAQFTKIMVRGAVVVLQGCLQTAR
jgi:hypothetical protein